MDNAMIDTTASVINAVLAFTNPKNTPKICYDNDKLTIPLIDKLKACVGINDGSQKVYLNFNEDEKELQHQFNGICKNISSIFKSVEFLTEPE